MDAPGEVLLVVDDNPENRDVLSRRLERKGYKVLVAEGGRQALELMQQHTVDLVLLDIMMPEMNGIEVLQRVRENRTSTDLPVIMVSADSDSDQVVEALELGANDYITKPVDFAVALARVQTQLKQCRARRQANQPDPNFKVTVGGRLAHYQIQKLLGEGGMGRVYKALDTRLDREVALKVMVPEALEDATGLDRFLQEARSIAKIHHPSVVSIYDVGVVPLPYLAMELVEGKTLQELLDKQPLEPWFAARMLLKICEALEEVHQKGIIHRDLKPANIMVDPEGRIHLMDFGLARLLQQSVGLTSSGAALGTPTHMAPEQLDSNQTPNEQTDIWALGVILYEMLTGVLPFSGNLEQVLTGILTRPPAPVRQVQPGVPEALETICTKCIERQRKDRYPGTAELQLALRAFLRSQARPTGAESSGTLGAGPASPASAAPVEQPAPAHQPWWKKLLGS